MKMIFRILLVLCLVVFFEIHLSAQSSPPPPPPPSGGGGSGNVPGGGAPIAGGEVILLLMAASYGYYKLRQLKSVHGDEYPLKIE